MTTHGFNNNGLSGHHSHLHQYKEQLRRLKEDTINELSVKMDDLIGKADPLPAFDALHKAGKTFAALQKSRRPDGELRDKVFIIQNSVLTDLFRSSHIQTIQNMSIASFIVWMLVASTTDALDERSLQALSPAWHVLEHCFENYQLALVFWLLMQLLVFLLYPLCYFWNHVRPSGEKGWFDTGFMAFYAMYQVFFLFLPSNILFRNPVLGPACSVAVALEQLRLVMKMHSFYREVTKKILRTEECIAKKTDGDDSEIDVSAVAPQFPGFNKYLYFLFAPTLIYRDEYPRTESVNWSYVCSNFFQFFGCTLMFYYLLQRYMRPEFSLISLKGFTLEHVLRTTFRCTVPGIATQMLVFFALLHSWMNAWAEMLRFGDRLFYKDWWNTSSFAGFYRSWNCIVHDWLYIYIYKESIEYFKIRHKCIAAMLVFTLSAFFHEYAVVSALRFCYPVLLCEFGILGFSFIFVNTKGRLANVLMWVCLILGMGLLLSLYSLEIAARNSCPQTLDSFTDKLIPRSWSCVSWHVFNNSG